VTDDSDDTSRGKFQNVPTDILADQRRRFPSPQKQIAKQQNVRSSFSKRDGFAKAATV
jgi:hypothetical protein